MNNKSNFQNRAETQIRTVTSYLVDMHATITPFRKHVSTKPPRLALPIKNLLPCRGIGSNFKFISISGFVFRITFNLSRLTRSRSCYNLTPLNLFLSEPGFKASKVYTQIPPSAVVNESSTEAVVFSIQKP